jgi:hypothetical protein
MNDMGGFCLILIKIIHKKEKNMIKAQKMEKDRLYS